MTKHTHFEKIHSRFINQFEEKEGTVRYTSWLKSKGYDETRPLPTVFNEVKERFCAVRGVEIKELKEEYHVEGLIATSHLDDYDLATGMKDHIPKETLESFANQINTEERARVMGIHHSEGRPINAEYYGIADVDNTPAEVIKLSDGEFGLFVDTKLLKKDPKTPEIINDFESGELNSFSITYNTKNFETIDFDHMGGEIVRIIGPETELHGYTGASNPINSNAVTTSHGFKEFKEMIKNNKKEVGKMTKKEVEETVIEKKEAHPKKEDEKKVEKSAPKKDDAIEKKENKVEKKEISEKEMKEFRTYQEEKLTLEKKEELHKLEKDIIKGVVDKMEKKEKVLTGKDSKNSEVKVSLERKAFLDIVADGKSVEQKEQFRSASAMCKELKIDWDTAVTSRAESREYKHFGIKGNKLEFKALGLTTNQNTDSDYLQSTAELNDVYDPIIYNAINQKTITWNILRQEDFSSKGNNMVQFKLKIAANASAAYYTGNSVATDNVGRLKYQTKFKKVQVGVSVDGDMIAAARGGPVGDVFALEVSDSIDDMMAVSNAALYDEIGLETVAAPIGFEYITDSAGNTLLYNLTRTAANKLAPDAAGDTYISGSSVIISMVNLRAAIRQAELEGAERRNLVFFTHHVQADLFKGKFDDATRFLTSKDTDFGFKASIFIDDIPVFTDKDCNTDDWFLVDLDTHRNAIWVPPTIEKLGKTADNEEAFVKMYHAIYNRAPRRMVQIHTNATS